MARITGALLRTITSFIRLLQLCCALAILGIFAYFIALLHRNGLGVPRVTQAVEGIAGAAAIWSLIALLLTLCIGGAAAWATVAILLDVLCIGAFIAVAVLTRGSVTRCNPLGNADATGPVTEIPNGNAISLSKACRLEKACFALAIALIGLFLLSAIFQILTTRNHKKDKANRHNSSNGPVIANEKKQPFYKRRTRGTQDTEHAPDLRPSHDSRLTDNTMVPPVGTAHHDSPTNAHKPYTNGSPAVVHPITPSPNRNQGYAQAYHNPEMVNSDIYRQGGDENLGYNTAEAANAAYNSGGHTAYGRTNY